ncbi:hypothetical protein IFT84_20650 [Rhizobium sp. CFBP 8762]|uniref:hypothetical protein n=1 Tax=Rhizobium sp. CFBP 8762 TaxID=2775279 RepID=UPI0017829860|nr:hypothetical protein [Rhizobium sp. CFBP 8762]MBD8556923.1 hypothetical protein [Rhizobium sp. CFBP 8762]
MSKNTAGFGTASALTHAEMGNGTYTERMLALAIPSQIDSNGYPVNPDGMAQTLAYTGDNLTSIQASDGVGVWVKTFTYTNGKLTGVSAWVKQ